MKANNFFTSGFTLIEMIVSLAVFSIIVTTAIGSLLVLINNNQKLQGEQSVMTNLSFALDSMTREIRTGYNYYCEGRASYSAGGNNNIFEDGNNHESILGESTQDCPNGKATGDNLQGISFFEGGSSILGTSTTAQRILYFYDVASSTIKRKVGNQDAQTIISSGLEILAAEFVVTGSTPQADGDVRREQPTVTVYMQAQEIGETKTYELQTTVTQRILDL